MCNCEKVRDLYDVYIMYMAYGQRIIRSYRNCGMERKEGSPFLEPDAASPGV